MVHTTAAAHCTFPKQIISDSSTLLVFEVLLKGDLTCHGVKVSVINLGLPGGMRLLDGMLWPPKVLFPLVL